MTPWRKGRALESDAEAWLEKNLGEKSERVSVFEVSVTTHWERRPEGSAES